MRMAPWQLQDGWGMLHRLGMRCAVETVHPDRGLQQIRLDDINVTQISPLHVTAEPPTPPGGEVVVESYVRGDDLVVTYAQTPSRTARPQIYWRAIGTERGLTTEGGFVGVELWLSVQTSLLSSNPSLSLTTGWRGGAELWCGARREDGSWDWQPRGEHGKNGTNTDATTDCYLLRLPGLSFSYCEMVYPGDGGAVRWHDGKSQSSWQLQLFLHDLEKGVIRRGRVRGIFARRDSDFQGAAACYEAMCAAPLPLTA